MPLLPEVIALLSMLLLLSIVPLLMAALLFAGIWLGLRAAEQELTDRMALLAAADPSVRQAAEARRVSRPTLLRGITNGRSRR